MLFDIHTCILGDKYICMYVYYLNIIMIRLFCVIIVIDVFIIIVIITILIIIIITNLSSSLSISKFYCIFSLCYIQVV